MIQHIRVRTILNERSQEQNADEPIPIDPVLLDEDQVQSQAKPKRLIRDTIDTSHSQYKSLSNLFPKKPCDLPDWA